MLHLTADAEFEVFVTPGILDYQVPEGMVGWTDANRQHLIDESKAAKGN